MIKLGPIVMPCRYCDALPGELCRQLAAGRRDRKEFHTARINDAKRASELLA